MNTSDIKSLIIKSLEEEADPQEASVRLGKEGVSYDFKDGFCNRILERLPSNVLRVKREIEFVKYLNLAFYRIALTGVAAIIVLIISIFLSEGSFSMNSFLGLNDTYDESIICLLTGE
jgi:hypothetical protein